MDSDALFWSILICGVLAILSNKHTAFLFLPSETFLSGWIPPPIIIFLAFFTTPAIGCPNFRAFKMQDTNEILAGYVYLAFGFGFSLSNIRRHRIGLCIYGIIFSIVFGLFIFWNLSFIIQMREQIIRFDEQMGY